MYGRKGQGACLAVLLREHKNGLQALASGKSALKGAWNIHEALRQWAPAICAALRGKVFIAALNLLAIKIQLLYFL